MFLHDFENRIHHKLEEINPDSVRGADICRVYDVTQYPAVIATSDEGQLRNMWSGLPLPLINEVSYYV